MPIRPTLEWVDELSERGMSVGSLYSAIEDVLAAAPTPEQPAALVTNERGEVLDVPLLSAEDVRDFLSMFVGDAYYAELEAIAYGRAVVVPASQQDTARELAGALREIVLITDRTHDAWNRARVALDRYDG
ncbi:MAG: hypothetical protein WC551_10805 [Patescibacteria group bacterium]